VRTFYINTYMIKKINLLRFLIRNIDFAVQAILIKTFIVG